MNSHVGRASFVRWLLPFAVYWMQLYDTLNGNRGLYWHIGGTLNGAQGYSLIVALMPLCRSMYST